MKLFKCTPRYSYGDGEPFILHTVDAESMEIMKEFATSIAGEDCGHSEHYRGVTVEDLAVDSEEGQAWIKETIKKDESKIEDLKDSIEELKKHLTK
jgi:hypothetical protein